MSIPVPTKCLHLFDYVIPVELSCYRKKHIVGLITHLPEVLQVLPLQSIHTLRGPQYRTTKSSTSVEVSSYQFKDTTHWFIIATANLLLHNATHLLQFVLRESRCQQEFVDKLEGRIKLGIDNL